jgi:plasmid stabilization system protein ParE
MAKVTWDVVALDDLEEIARFIERDSPVAAERLVKRIFDRVDSLERHPLSGGFIDDDPQKVISPAHPGQLPNHLSL